MPDDDYEDEPVLLQPETDAEDEADAEGEADEAEATEVDDRDARIAELETALSVANARCESMAQSLFTNRVGALGLLADPTDMTYDASLLDDGAALEAAVLALLAEKPHLGAMRVSGDIDQGPQEEPQGDNVSLLGLMKDLL